MNSASIREVFASYETIRDSMKIARRSVNRRAATLQSGTVFLGRRQDEAIEQLGVVAEEFDEIMVLSLFAAFERELRLSLQTAVYDNVQKTSLTIQRTAEESVQSIERWTIGDMVDLLQDVVPSQLRGSVKQLHEYRNWVAHGKNPDRPPSVRTDPKATYFILEDFINSVGNAV